MTSRLAARRKFGCQGGWGRRGPVQSAMPMRLDMRRIEAVRIQPKHGVIQCTA